MFDNFGRSARKLVLPSVNMFTSLYDISLFEIYASVSF